MKNMNSSFWLGDDFFEDNNYDILSDKPSKPKGKDPIKLAGYRRAIGNFVRIVTGEPISVKFNSQGASYTDGKTVTISASLKDKDFDSAVGLALHEGSHIKLTDFELLEKIDDWIQSHDKVVDDLAKKHGDVFKERWDVTYYIASKLKDFINIVEDRRIDNWVYKNAPGYRGYYEALYDKYFNAKIVDKGLESAEYRTEDWDSYFFRICNITNPKRDLDALKSLRKIWNIIDLKNISRLKSTSEVQDIAWKIFLAIEENIPPMKKQENGKGENELTEGEGTMSSEDVDQMIKDIEDGKAVVDDGSKADGEEAKKSTGKGVELTSKQLGQLKKAIQKQKDFQNNDVKKTKVTNSMQKTLTSMEKSGVSISDVGYELLDYTGKPFSKKNIDVTVIKNFTKDLVDTVDCGMWTKWDSYISSNREHVNEGIRRGVVLGKKLKVRSEERNLKFNRLRSGKIDKRMISNAGYGAEGIFEKIESFAYNPGIIHISIDNSGSMYGRRMAKAVTTAVAVAKACSMIDNMDCVISFRASSYMIDRKNEKPIILIAYDSRKHSMVQIRTMMPYVTEAGLTPEGLCFSAILDEIVGASRGKDAYFVNFSDGQPYYKGYQGETAYKHTRQQIKKMIREGIKVISYFIDGRSEGHSANVFRQMYGKDAQFINTSKISDVAKSMNKKFLEISK
ncbi:MAG: hypothetical protein H8E55_64260 [Pelagibacterales bacterium]|nr:hypothetical protein [Pelagibacterales bacterium]